MERSLRVLDGAVVILDGTRGVEAQTVTVWKQLQKFQVPRIVFLNKLDREKGSLELCLSSIRDVFNTVPVLVNYPLYNGEGQLVGVTASPPSPQHLTETVEALANFDESLEELYFANNCEAEKIPSDMIMSSIKRLHSSGKIVPVCVGSGLKGVGVDSCLDSILHFLPSPLESFSKLPPQLKDHICGVVFKSSLDRQRGVLCQSRLYSGSLQPRSRVFNTRTGTVGQISSLFQLEAGTMIVRDNCQAGQIGVFTGCKDFRTGDIFVDASWKTNQAELRDIISSNSTLKSTLSHANPLFFCNVECESSFHQEKLEQALVLMTFEDPTLVLKKGSNDELLLGGTGQLHLSVVRERLKQEHGLECKVYQFRVNYLETVCEPSQSCLDDITVSISPCSELSNDVRVSVPGSGVEKATKELVERTVHSCLAIGPIIGAPLVNCRVRVRVEGLEGNLPEQALRDLAKSTRLAMRSTFANSSLSLCEPHAEVVVEGPVGCSGALISDFNSRSPDYEMEYDNNQDFRLVGTAPLSELVDYVAVVRSLSRGSATVLKVEMTNYQAMDQAQSQDIVKLFKSGQISM